MTYKRISQIDGLNGSKLVRLYIGTVYAFEYREPEYQWKDITFEKETQLLSFSDDFTIVKFIKNALE